MKHRLQTIVKFGGVVFLIGLVAGGIFLVTVIQDLPDPTRISEKPVSQSTKIYDRARRTLLYEIHGEEKRTLISFSDIPLAVRNATIAAEDANFYSHGGIDFKGILRALYADIKSQNIQQGGSTITQQLIKNTLLGKEQTVKRKIKEVVLAILLESKYSKDEILSLYLNQIPYGSNAYGIEAAAETYFATSTKHLTLAEAALLATLPRAPSYYSPYGPHKQELMGRKDTVLDRMKSIGFISEKDAESAKKEKLAFEPMKTNIQAPHFVMYVRDYLEEHYDTQTIENGGLRITTTLDWDAQQKAEKIISDSVARNKDLGAKNTSLVAIDPRTGQIIAMVGSIDYFDVKNDGNVNVATRLRQPGSAFKPLAYVTALQKGYTPETILFDVPTEFNPLCNSDATPGPGIDEKDCYHPQNYDGQFRGPVTMRQALQQSLNIPSVEILYLAGIEDTIKTAEALGITSLKDRSRFGLSLVLGGAEVKLLELTAAYGAFAEDGILNPMTPILKIEDAEGNTLEEYKQNQISAVDTEAARTLNSILIDNDARVPIFIRNSSLYFPDRQVAAKTGTTQDNRDAWTIGYTPSLVAGVWVGNNDNTAMNENTAGVLVAAPLWHAFMQQVLATSTPEQFTPPTKKEVSKAVLKGFWQGSGIMKIDTISKKQATALTPPEFIREVPIGNEIHSILYWVNKNDPEGPIPENPASDAQFKNWEDAIQKWITATRFKVSQQEGVFSQETDDIHTEANRPVITLIDGANGVLSETATFLRVQIHSVFSLQEISAKLDQHALPITRSGNDIFTVLLPSGLSTGFYSLSISASDVYGNMKVLERMMSVR